jgi:hypothetical protein
MRRCIPLNLVVALVVAVSLNYNLSLELEHALSRTMENEVEVLSPSVAQHSTKTKTTTRPALQILGISSSPEMRTVILQTYLHKNKNNGKHAFSNACPLERYMHNSSCTMAYKFLDESVTETNWWKDLAENDVLLTPHQNNINPLVLWTTGKTILYPKYLTSALNQVWNNDASNDHLIYATASSTDCRRIRPKSDQRVCNKLTGTLTVASYQTVLRTRSCWSVSQQDLEQCRTSLNLTIHQLPRQLQQPDPDSFLTFWNTWLVSWNELPSKLTYITAKFGIQNKFRNQVGRSRSALLSVGLDQEQVHAYYEFPDFIMEDPRWKLHLEFLDDSVIPPVRPKGGGYYFWKAPLMLHHLEQSKDGDFIVYADIDRRDHIKWLKNLLQFMHQSNTSLALYETDLLERQYNKRDAYQYYCSEANQDQVKDSTRQYGSSLVVIRKTPTILSFLKDWQDGMTHYTMLNDRPSSEVEDVEDFVHHKHDQSLLSVLLKCHHAQAYNERLVFEGANNSNKNSSTDWPVHVFRI